MRHSERVRLEGVHQGLQGVRLAEPVWVVSVAVRYARRVVSFPRRAMRIRRHRAEELGRGFPQGKRGEGRRRLRRHLHFLHLLVKPLRLLRSFHFLLVHLIPVDVQLPRDPPKREVQRVREQHRHMLRDDLPPFSEERHLARKVRLPPRGPRLEMLRHPSERLSRLHEPLRELRGGALDLLDAPRRERLLRDLHAHGGGGAERRVG
mmetsp:Transcript_9154/g.21545  ORF Transcript_9154/g.21545 Transcript_9154/m.21545 type:complete len:206 (-) Transcript_9154:494-1111(-)